MNLNSLKDVYIEQLKDMYSAEKQLTDALPKLASAASDDDLQMAFNNHLTQTVNHMETVRSILDDMGENPGSTKCKAMEGLIKEGSDIANMSGNSDAKDAALIVAAQKVEHYEIATYGSLRTFARSLGRGDEADKLQAILDEEYDADQKLDTLAEGPFLRSGLNDDAKR